MPKITVAAIAAILVLIIFAKPLKAEDAKPDAKMRDRLEQLFIWRVSDKLALSSDQEAKFSETYKKLSREKKEESQNLDSLLDKLEKSKSDKAAAADLVKKYEAALARYNNLQTKELQTMAKIFDTQRLAEYLLIKRELMQKFKDFLGGNRPAASKEQGQDLKEPEVIQEH